MFWHKHKLELPNPEVMEVDLIPGCSFCELSYQQGGHVLYQAARFYGKTQLEGREAFMCESHYEAYGTGRVWRVVLREKNDSKVT